MQIELGKTYLTRENEKIRIIAVDVHESDKFPIVGINSHGVLYKYTLEGKRRNPLGSTANIHLVSEFHPEIDWKIDDKIEVSEDGKEWNKRHFAGLETINGKTLFLAYRSGGTSWTCSKIMKWEFARKPE